MPVVTCPHCSNAVTLPDPWAAPGYTCPHCHQGVPVRILAPVTHTSAPQPPELPRDSRSEDRRRTRREERDRHPAPARRSFIQAHSLLFVGGGLSAGLLLLVVACCGGLIYSSGAKREAAQKELAEAHALWDAGKKAEAAGKYASVLDRGYSDLPPAAEKPVVYQRVIDLDLERGDTDAARARVEKALDKNIDIAPGSPASKQLIAQVRADRERRAAEERAAREKREADERAEATRKRNEETQRNNERVEAEAKRKREEREAREKRAETETEVDGLVLLKESTKGTGNEFGGEITGTVINRTGKKLRYAQITFNLYDASGAQVGTALANVNGLEPGGRWNFTASSLGTKFVTFKFSELWAIERSPSYRARVARAASARCSSLGVTRYGKSTTKGLAPRSGVTKQPASHVPIFEAPMLTAALLLCLTADPTENVYRDSKSGDWVEWTGGDVVMRHSVHAKKDKALTLRIEQTVGGKKGAPIDQEIDLTKPWPPVPEPNPDVKTVTEELGAGTEELALGGKKYPCAWAKRRTTIAIKGQEDLVSVTKVWICKDVPLGGVVRTESAVAGKTYTTEMTGFGRGK